VLVENAGQSMRC